MYVTEGIDEPGRVNKVLSTRGIASTRPSSTLLHSIFRCSVCRCSEFFGTSSIVGSNNTGDEALGQCIAKAAKKWTFPKPVGGGTVKVTYPFNLSPG